MLRCARVPVLVPQYLVSWSTSVFWLTSGRNQGGPMRTLLLSLALALAAGAARADDNRFYLGAGASHAQPSVTSGDSDGIRRDRVAPAAKRCPRIGACADSSRVPAAPRFHPPTLR